MPPRIKFPEKAQNRFTEGVVSILDKVDTAIVERLAQQGLRLDAEGELIDPKKVQGAVAVGASIVEDSDLTGFVVESINLADEINKGEIERTFREAGASLAVQPELEDEAFRRFRKKFKTSAKEELQDHLDFVEKEVTTAIREGRRAEEVADVFQERLEISRSKAKLNARDQIGTFNSFQTETRLKKAGIKKYRWLTSKDERVRPEHRALGGTIQRWDQPPLPGHPGEDWLCRCDSVPIINDSGPTGGVNVPESRPRVGESEPGD